jgi:hypothetical protein
VSFFRVALFGNYAEYAPLAGNLREMRDFIRRPFFIGESERYVKEGSGNRQLSS